MSTPGQFRFPHRMNEQFPGAGGLSAPVTGPYQSITSHWLDPRHGGLNLGFALDA